MTTTRWPVLALGALLVAILALLAWGARRQGSPSPPVDQAAADRAALERVVEADQALDIALREADRALARSDEKAATTILQEKALPRVDEALRALEAVQVTTPWGRDRKEEWAGALMERQAGIRNYIAALGGESLEERVEVLEAQAALERKMIDLVARTRSGPP